MSASEFKLPKGISLVREDLEDGGYSYTVQDLEIGPLGRILLQGIGDGKTHLAVEIFGDPDDPLIEDRKKIIEPIGQKIMSLMREKVNESLGEGESFVTIPSVSSDQMETVQMKVDICEVCAKPSSLLIFAPDAKGSEMFEYYAGKLRHKFSEENVPTWIIGAVAKEDPPEGPSCYVLKVWPQKEKIEALRPEQVNPLIENHARTHCTSTE